MIKIDKSGNLGGISRKKYLEMGSNESKADKEIDRDALKKIEKKINDHTRIICKIVNAGEARGHIESILSSKKVNYESSAPKFYRFTNHKESESWRPVIAGCSSNTLDLSNILSDIVESLCGSISNPYEVIRSEDLLSWCEIFNKWASEHLNI